MPSGAKKRKAAKKKKEIQIQSDAPSDSAPAPPHPHGDDDVKQQEDRESDAGEVNSPISQDHQKLPDEEEKDAGGESSIINNGEEKVGVEESVVQVEKEIKIEDEFSMKNGIGDHDEANRKSYDGDSYGSSSSSSSSDDESRGIKKDTSIASVGSAEVADSLLGKPVGIVGGSLTAGADDSVVETIPAANSEKIAVLSEQVELDVLLPVSVSMAPSVVESPIEENGEEKSSHVEERNCKSLNASYEKEEANVRSSESSPKSLDPKESVTQEKDDRSISSCIGPRAAVDNGAQHVKDSIATQPVASSPYPIHKTTWKSCCGLFEMLAGSSA